MITALSMLRFLSGALLLFLLYVSAAHFGLALFEPVGGFASIVWPPSALALTALFIYGKRLWLSVAVGAFLVNLWSGAPVIAAFMIGTGNALEAIAGVHLLQRSGFNAAFRRIRDVRLFIFYGVFIAPITSATIGVSSLWISGVIPTSAYDLTWLAWWTGDAVGILLLAPFLMSWGVFLRRKKFSFPQLRARLTHGFYVLKKMRVRKTGRWAEKVIIFCMSIILGYLIFWSGARGASMPFLYLSILPPLWAASRFGTRGTSTTVLIISVFAIAGTVFSRGPFANQTLVENLFFLQIFLGIMATTSLIHAAQANQQRRADQRLRFKTARLAQTVEKRTRKLRHQAYELARRNSEVESVRALYEALLDSIGGGVVAIDATGSITFVNDTAAKIWGESREALIGSPGMSIRRNYTDLQGKPIPPEMRPLAVAMHTGALVLKNMVYIKDDRRTHLLVSAAPIHSNGTNKGAVATFYDVSKESRVEETKSKFVALVSHQFRTPISVIRWYTEILLSPEFGTLDNQQRHFIDEIHRTAKRMAELINTMLELTKIELGLLPAFTDQLIPLDMPIRVSMDTLKNDIREKHLTIEEFHDKHIPLLNLNCRLLEIVFENLLRNAVCYTPPKGSVRIRTAFDEKNATVMCSIEDTGYGIPANEHQKVFSELFRGSNIEHQDIPGSGFGLYIVKSLIDLVKGEIEFVSQENAGTTFTLTLPIRGPNKPQSEGKKIMS